MASILSGEMMKRSGTVKFPNSVNLFKFCQKVFSDLKGKKVNDQEIGNILEFNPSDCSHWKRGEKNIRSIFALAKLSATLQVDPGLLQDIAGGSISLNEAYFEHTESRSYAQIIQNAHMNHSPEELGALKANVLNFVGMLHKQANFGTPPLYFPEIVRFFSFVNSQPADMMDRLSRVLRVKPGHYVIQFRKGEMNPQVRMSMAKDLARVVLRAERGHFQQLGLVKDSLASYEELLFVSNLLLPLHMLRSELTKVEARKNMVSELGSLFWTPRILVNYQLQQAILTSGSQTAETSAPEIFDPSLVRAVENSTELGS